VLCRWDAGPGGATLVRDGPHAWFLDGVSQPAVELSCLLAPPGARYPIDADAPWLAAKAGATRALLAGQEPLPLFGAVAAAAAAGWAAFWEGGAAVDLAGGLLAGEHGDARALELERRVVLSQYLTRVNSAGSTPPQETGYTLNSWYGKHHHEMRWFHQAHFALWQRPELIQRADGWFRDMLPNATAYAGFQGYGGARWPKMVGPATTLLENPGAGGCFNAPSVGNTSYSNATSDLLYWTGPSSTGPMLVWQQPHIIWMTEVQRLHAPSDADAAAIVGRMAAVVEATADFMAAYPAPPLPGRANSSAAGELWLGPPTDGAEEGNPAPETWNPTFELTYWRLGLRIATEWRQRAGLPAKPAWARVLSNLAEPTVLAADAGGKHGPRAYAINANCWGFPSRTDETKEGKHKCSGAYSSHPMILGALGMVNGRAVEPPIDDALMNATLAYSIDGWDWDGTWGWDYPMWAFSQMRLGWDASAVVDMMLRHETKNMYFANGHNYQFGPLVCYLPGNGGLLSAVAMMAGGFDDGAGKTVPVGFPPAWGALSEGFKVYP